MARYAHIITATGEVENISLWDGVTDYTPPAGIELRLADDNTEIGGKWDGSEFVRAVLPTPPRIEVLMYEVKQAQKYDSDTDAIVDKTDDEVAAENLELKNLLTAKLVGGTNLTERETQTLLRLERLGG